MADLEHEEWMQNRQAQRGAKAERLRRTAKTNNNIPKKEDDEPKKKIVLDPVEEEEAE